MKYMGKIDITPPYDVVDYEVHWNATQNIR